MFRLVGRVIAPLALAGLAVLPALASTVVVPDDFPTVQLGIDSGADTVQVREGFYPESPLVDHAVVLQGIGANQRPRVNGMGINNLNFPLYGLPPLLSVSGMSFSGGVQYTTAAIHPRQLILRFADCSLDNGILVNAQDADEILLLSFSHCHLRNSSSAIMNEVSMVSDTVDGGISWFQPSAPYVSISDCWFRGGTGAALSLSGEPRGTVANNRIENYDTGIYVQDADALTVESNVISGCGTGIWFQTSYDTRVTGNEIRNCGVGVYVGSLGLRLIGNTIIGTTGWGATLSVDNYLVVEQNIIGRCGGGGIASGSSVATLMRSNTLFDNGGSAISIPGPQGYPVQVENNIAFRNKGWGLVASDALVRHGCNDWFGNMAGAVSGVAPDTTDLSVDPQFCGVDSGDVRLNSASPLLAVPGCGPVGALGVGCGVTPTLLQMLTVEPQGRGVVVRWRFGSDPPTVTWLERAGRTEGPWYRLTGQAQLDAGTYSEVDESIEPGATYWYRVGWQEGTGRELYSSPESYTAARLSWASRVFPNPSPGPVTIEWTLGAAADMEVRVLDLVGREVGRPARARFEPGTQRAQWDGRQSNGALAPTGWYVVRVRGGAIDAAHRLLVIR